MATKKKTTDTTDTADKASSTLTAATINALNAETAAQKAVSAELNAYDFVAEETALASLLAQEEPSPMEPDYPRLERYRAMVQLREDKQAAAKDSANVEVPAAEVRKLQAVSALQSQEQDFMTVHTQEAMRVYIGVSPGADTEHKFGVPGARRTATALRQLFLLTGMDNPYADLVLVETDERVAKIKTDIDKVRKLFLGKLDALKAKGLNYSVLVAKTPQTVSLGYHSPYGYMMSALVVEFDELVRILKTAERRDVMTKREQHEILYRIKRQMRGMFESILRGQRVLMAEAMRGLQRTDFASSDTKSDAVRRITAAKNIFGLVPTDVFMGQRGPRHTLRNERLSGLERQTLEALAQVQSTPIETSAAAELIE